MAERIYYSEDARQHATNKRRTLVAFAMLVGAGLGAIMTLLLSPLSGEEARRKVEDAVESGVEYAEDSADRVQNMVS